MRKQLAFQAVGDGPPVVVLHGLFGSGRNWAQLAAALAGRYRVYLPDARNHGASPWADAMDYSAMALDVLDLIQRERLDRPVVIGHSMGGKTAMALALEHPDAIGAVGVVDIAPVRYAAQFSSYVDAMRTLRRQDERFDWRINLMAVAVCMPQLCDFAGGLMTRRYDGPALFVAGALSAYVVPESLPLVARLFPQARLETVPDAGHWVHADQPAALLQLLKPWLAEAQPAALTSTA
jgi:pimeloyl-ACP methyl ester carboxylesterase